MDREKKEINKKDRLCDLAVERIVLSGILQHGEDAYIDCGDILQTSSFTDSFNQIIYKCVCHLYEEKDIKEFDSASIVASCYELGFGKISEKRENVQHLKSLFNSSSSKTNLRKWAGQLRKLSIARELYSRLVEASGEVEKINGSETIDHILSIAEKTIFDFTASLNEEDSSNPKLISDDIDAFLDNIESNPKQTIGISSGMPYYDKAIGGGFRRKTVSLISARSKVGKSYIALCMALHIAENLKIPVLYLDTEMTQHDHISRAIPNICTRNGVPITINEFESGSYSYSDFKKNKVREAAQQFKQLPLHYLNVSGKPFEETLSIMRRWTEKEVGYDECGNRKDCLIIYDYLKMMDGDGINDSLKEYQILGFYTTALHNFAVRYDVPILTMTQLNRDGIDKENQAVISGSDRILWLVTNFSIFKVKSDDEIAEDGPEAGNRKMVPVSARHGEGLEFGDYINVIFDGKHGRVIEGETKNNLRINKARNKKKKKDSGFEVDESAEDDKINSKEEEKGKQEKDEQKKDE